MKTVLAVILVVVIFAAGAYFGLPLLMQQETAALNTDVQDLKQRILGIEEFVRKEEEMRKTTELRPDADFHAVVQTVNGMSLKLSALEDALEKNVSSTDEAIGKQRASTEEALKEQTDTIAEISRETDARLQKNQFQVFISGVRGYLLKVKLDLAAKNIGTAKSELERISGTLEKMKPSVSDENRSDIEEIQKILKQVKLEVDTDLPAAENRIDLLWHELSKLLSAV